MHEQAVLFVDLNDFPCRGEPLGYGHQLLFGQVCHDNQIRKSHPGHIRILNVKRNNLFRWVVDQSFQPLDHLRLELFVLLRNRVQDLATADGSHR